MTDSSHSPRLLRTAIGTLSEETAVPHGELHREAEPPLTQANIAHGRLRLFSLGSSQPLLDVSSDDFEWPDDEGCRVLIVEDALELLPNDNMYRKVCKTGELRVMGEDEELVWGSSYQVVSSVPRVRYAD